MDINLKLRINAQAENRVKSKTIYYRIFTYFAAFSVVILITLWLLQIFFLQTFYQWMKSSELYSLADTIEEDVGNESLYDTISHLTVKSDMYIEIERGDSGVIYGTAQSLPSERMAQFAQRYNTSALKAKLLTEDVDHVVTKQTINPGNTETMIYASILGTDSETGELIYLFICSPLTPVGTTISILAKMLVIVTILSIFIGLVMSIVISRRLAQPLYSITDSAAQLAKGHYDIKFEGAGYAETEDLADTLNYAAAELSKSDKLQKDLVANVSHDLKTPLTMVKSYAEMIRDLSGDNPEKRNRHLQVIINEADRLNMLVNDLTSLSKMQAGVDSLIPAAVDLKRIASDVIESFSLHAEQDGFRFDIESQGDTTVTADEKKTYQVFSNIIGNAVRYSAEDRQITVRFTEKQDTVRCEIIDRGQGIAQKDLTAIWDRYYQSSSNLSRTTKGSGLGLSIVKQIFILHGAKYGVESEIDKGSNFWFELKKDMSVSPAEKNKGRKKAGEKTMRFSAAVKNLRGQADPPPQAAPEPSGAEISLKEPVSSESPAPKSSGPVTSAWQSSSGQMQAPHSGPVSAKQKGSSHRQQTPAEAPVFPPQACGSPETQSAFTAKKDVPDEK